MTKKFTVGWWSWWHDQPDVIQTVWLWWEGLILGDKCKMVWIANWTTFVSKGSKNRNHKFLWKNLPTVLKKRRNRRYAGVFEKKGKVDQWSLVGNMEYLITIMYVWLLTYASTNWCSLLYLLLETMYKYKVLIGQGEKCLVAFELFSLLTLVGFLNWLIRVMGHHAWWFWIIIKDLSFRIV